MPKMDKKRDNNNMIKKKGAKKTVGADSHRITTGRITPYILLSF
jgi:hypothetical protein